mmetsp:Transcript_18514/g.49663  ORF Transcript_18514/g.49663 Transcript_18514/m.49663 type:complete len:100 (-) Transcript_18514:212-511(-)
MPILDEGGLCVGLIDAESWTAGFFDDSRVATVARCACDLAESLVWLGFAPREPVRKVHRTDNNVSSMDCTSPSIADSGVRYFLNGALTDKTSFEADQTR